MKKLFPYILVIIIAFGIFIPTHFADAQTQAVTNFLLSGISGTAKAIVAPIVSFIFYLLQKVIALFMGISGVVLNYTIQETIVDMSANLRTMTGINIAWKVIRDIMNIGFIFMLVYYGIMLIIGQGNVATIRKFIIGIVLASILINFSLFFTKVIIDGSNIVTIGIYNSIMVATPNAGTGNSTGLSNAFQQSLGLQGFFSTAEIPVGDEDGDYGPMVANIMACVLFLITTFVFLVVSIMLIIRYIILLILLAFSPIAYMGMALSSIKKYSDQWWDTLWGQILFPPIYMLMTWVVLTLVRSGGFIIGNIDPRNFGALGNVQTGADISGAIGLFFNFALIIGLVIASLIISKSFATKGSNQIGKMTSAATAFAGGAIGGAVVGGSARFARNTVGRAGNAVANSERLKEMELKGGIAGRWAAKAAIAGGSRAAESTFDARATKSLQKAASVTGFNLGKVDPKNNFKKIREEQIKATVDDAKKYKPSDLAVASAKATLASDDFVREERERELRNVGKQRQNILEEKAEVDNAVKDIQSKFNSTKKEEDKLAEELAKLNAKPSARTASEEKQKNELTNKITVLRQEREKHASNLKAKEEESNRKKINLESIDKEYKNTEEGRRRKGIEETKATIDKETEKLQTKLNSVKAEQNTLTTELSAISAKPVKTDEDKIRQSEVTRKIADLREQSVKSTLAVEKYMNDSAKQQAELARLDLEEKHWMSDEKKKLLSLSGEKDKDKNPLGIKNAYVQRLEAAASREENKGKIWRWTANLAGNPLSAVVPMTPKSKATREEIARQIRKLGEEKSKKDKAQDAVLEYMKAQAEEDTSETPASTPVAPPPPPAPEPPQATA